MKSIVHHGHTTTFQHCLNVSYYNYFFCKLLSFDARSAARGGLLHDLFLYDWHLKEYGGPKHAWGHAGFALVNAKKHFELNEIEIDIIKKHMFPLNIALPRYRETVVITIVDKICGIWEVVDHWGYVLTRRLPYKVTIEHIAQLEAQKQLLLEDKQDKIA